MPPLSEKELEERLAAAGRSLVQPPCSLDELLSLLDQIERLLSKVEQSPAKSMYTALSPLMKALVMEDLLKHSDSDVKVGVASCISEITRITAPDAPYDDDKMKDVFQLIVSSFENLSDMSSRSYEKRVTILETVAKVRSCVIMLDLECDQMIIEMFQHFLKAIRAYHPEIIFASMETIVTLVLEESEDISSDLLAPILSTLKRNNEAVMPIAKKLAERVIENSADKLRPYLRGAVKSLDTSLDDYSEAVASACRENTDTVGHSNESILNDQPAGKDGSEETNIQDKDPTATRSPKSVVSNGINETGLEEIMQDANSSKTAGSNRQLDAKSMFKTDSDASGAQNPVHSEAKEELAEFQQVPYNHEVPEKDVLTSPTKVKPAEAAKSLDKIEESNIQLSLSDAPESEAKIVASPTQSGSHPDESQSETDILGKGKGNLVSEEIVSVDTASKKVSEGESVSKEKKQQRPGKKQSADLADKDETLTEEIASRNDDGCACDSEARSLEQAEKGKGNFVGEEVVSVDSASKKASEGEYIKKQRRLGKKQTVDTADKDGTLTEEVASKNDGCASDSEARSLDQAEKRIGNLASEEMVSVDTASKKASEGQSISEAKKQRPSGNKRTADSADKGKTLTVEVASKNDDGHAGDSKAQSLDQAKKGKGSLVSEEMLSIVTASKKASKGESISQAKKQRHSGKKRTTDSADNGKTLTLEVASKNGDGCAGDSEAQSLYQAKKMEDASAKTEYGSSLRREDSKMSGHVKHTSEEDALGSAREDHDKDTITFRKSPLKSTKNEGIQEESHRTSNKRKQTPGKEKASETPEYGENLIGSKIKVWWPKDRMFYEGEIASFDPVKKKHKVFYTDGDEEVLNLRRERWEFIRDDLVSEGEQDVELSSHGTSSDMKRKKKGNANPETSSKRQKVEDSPKSKLKDTAPKSGGKSKDRVKAESESKGSYSKTSKKYVEDDTIKSKDQTQKLGGKVQVDSAKASSRSKGDVAQVSSYSKQDSGRTSKSKVDKAQQSGKTLSPGGTKSKVKETDPTKERTARAAKSTDAAKSRESETKGGKKQRG